jgi:hypothetical protein
MAWSTPATSAARDNSARSPRRRAGGLGDPPGQGSSYGTPAANVLRYLGGQEGDVAFAFGEACPSGCGSLAGASTLGGMSNGLLERQRLALLPGGCKPLGGQCSGPRQGLVRSRPRRLRRSVAALLRN